MFSPVITYQARMLLLGIGGTAKKQNRGFKKEDRRTELIGRSMYEQARRVSHGVQLLSMETAINGPLQNATKLWNDTSQSFCL